MFTDLPRSLCIQGGVEKHRVRFIRRWNHIASDAVVAALCVAALLAHAVNSCTEALVHTCSEV